MTVNTRISREKSFRSVCNLVVIVCGLVMYSAWAQGADPLHVTTDVAALVAEGEKRMARGDLEGALAVFDTAMARDTNNAKTLNFAANLSWQLVYSLRFKSDNTRLLLALAQTYEHYGLDIDAIRVYQQIIINAPDSSDARESDWRAGLLMAKQNIKEGEQQKAQQQLTLLLHDYPDIPDVVSANTSFQQSGTISQDTTTGLTKELPLQPTPVSGTEDNSTADIAGEVTTPHVEPATETVPTTTAEEPASSTESTNVTESASVVVMPLATTTVEAERQAVEDTTTTITGKELPSTAEPVTTIPTPASEDTRPIITPETPSTSEHIENTKSILPTEKKSIPADAVSTDTASLISEGKNLMARDPKGALQMFEKVLAQDPDNAEVLYYAGNLHLQLNQAELGLKYLKRTTELAPKNTRLLLLLAQAYERFGTTEDAINTYQQVITISPESPEAGEAEKRKQLLTEKQALTQSIQDTSSQTSSHSAMIAGSEIANLINEGKNRMARDPQGALQMFEKVLAQDPDNAEVLYYAGNLYLQLNQPEQGLKYLKRTTELAPDNARLLFLLAQARERFGNAGDAINTYQQVITIAPGSPEASEASKRELLLSGKLAITQGNPDKASQIFLQLVTTNPNDETVLAEIITTYTTARSIDELRHFLESVMASQPDNRLVLTNLANLYDRANNFPKAIEHYEHLLQLLPAEENAKVRQDISQRLYTLKGTLALQNNDFDTARDNFEDFLSVEPDNINARMNLATAYRGLEDRAKTEEILSGIVQDHPDNLIARLKLGVLYLEMERKADAARQLEETRIRGRNQPEGNQATQFLGNIYSSDGGDQIRDSIQGEIIQGFLDRLAEQPDDYDTWSKLGFMHLVRQEFKGAREAYENMSHIKPEEIDTRIILATLYNRTGDSESAEKILIDIIQSHPDKIEARIELGSLYIGLERMTDAARQLEMAKIIGKDSPLTNQAAQLLTRVYSGDDGEAIKKQVKDELILPLKTRVDEEPDNFEAWSKLADTYLAFEMFEEAREAYENLARLKPEDLQAQGFLAELYDRSADYGNAESAYIKALELIEDPDIKKNIEEKLMLVQGKKALNENELDLAETKFKDVITENPQNFIPHIYLASIYGSQDKFDDSIREYEEVIKLVPAHAIAHLNLARIYEQVKRDEDALTEYQTALRLALPEDLKENAQQRISAVQKRINGFTYTFNYSTSYQSNFNLTKDDPVEEFVHNLSAGINYRYKLDQKPVYLGVILNSSYIIYQSIQFDFLSMGATPYTAFTWKGLDYTASLNFSNMEDFLHQTESNKSSSFNADVSGSFRMHSLIPWLANDTLRKAAPSTWQLSLAARQFETATSPINDARNYSLGGTINQTIGNGWSWTAGYDYIENKNLDDLGNDLAYVSNGISLQLTKFIKTGFSINGGYTYALRNYTNNDSATLFTEKRTNINQRYSGGLNYFINEKLRLFANVSYTINESNLPTGFIFDPTDIGTAVAFQSTSLGDYTSLVVTTGIALSL